MIGFLFYAVIVLTYALPWVRVSDEWYYPGQLVYPYLKFGLTQIGIFKHTEDSPPTIGDVMVYEKSLRYLGAPPEEGGPYNQITFELMAFAMIAVLVILLIPLKFLRIIGYLISIASASAFSLAMIFHEQKPFDALNYGIFTNIICSFIFLIITFLLK